MEQNLGTKLKILGPKARVMYLYLGIKILKFLRPIFIIGRFNLRSQFRILPTRFMNSLSFIAFFVLFGEVVEVGWIPGPGTGTPPTVLREIGSKCLNLHIYARGYSILLHFWLVRLQRVGPWYLAPVTPITEFITRNL